MSATERLDKSLQNLICSGRCPPEEAGNYGKKLRHLAQSMTDPESLRQKEKMFKALGDRTRLSIINLLQVRDMCVCEITAALNLTQPTASHHLMILENAGIIEDKKEGKWVFYSISDNVYIKSLLQLRL